jgi:serine/threonine-protein kinase
MLAAHKGLPVETFPAPPKVPQVAAPNVVGKSQTEAQSILAGAGFSVKVDTVASSLAAGTVVAQDPPAGKQVDPGVLVRLQVSDGTGAPTPSPSPSPEPSTSTPPETPAAEPT